MAANLTREDVRCPHCGKSHNGRYEICQKCREQIFEELDPE